MTTQPLTAQDHLKGIRSGNRQALSQAITLVESTREDHRILAREVIKLCMSSTGNAFRIGITGAPGVGKSTFIDTLGMHMIEAGKQVAVLAIDPSSAKTGGSILGDKTRMARLSREPKAFIRPSPSSGSLGGIASRTREAMFLCEAAGFDVLFVETVGVGQSEFSVHQMVDMLLLLLITGAGDDLQGIKRGIMEMADMIVINKADGPNEPAAQNLLRLIRQAVHVLPAPRSEWASVVQTASAVEDRGIEEIAAAIDQFEKTVRASKGLELNRQQQALTWMYQLIEEGWKRRLKNNPRASSKLTELEDLVVKGLTSPHDAADTILGLLSPDG